MHLWTQIPPPPMASGVSAVDGIPQAQCTVEDGQHYDGPKMQHTGTSNVSPLFYATGSGPIAASETHDSVACAESKPSGGSLDDVRPAYFYPMDAYSGIVSASDDREPSGVPVFEPTMEQFADFYSFAQAIDKWGMQTGIVKVVPPREWVEALPSVRPSAAKAPEQARLDRVRIREAITQHFIPAGPGRWKQTNVTRSKVFDAKQWGDLCADATQCAPSMTRIQRKVAADLAAEHAHVQSRAYDATPTSAAMVVPEGVRTRSGGTGSDTLRPTRARKLTPTTDDDWEAFDYERGWTREWLSEAERAAGHALTPSAWDPATCRAIEAEYWRGLNLGHPPMYGADQQGTLFDGRTTAWNVGTLDSWLSRRLQCALPGVTTPYLYFGMWRASFAWHVEDMDLHSINYIHFGAPKQWYAIRQADRRRFESAMSAAFPSDSRQCPHFLRHKSFLASPSFLTSQGIRPLRLVQHAHEFVITYPYGYHAGYNLGFNCAESVNFALPSWIKIGQEAGYCKCPLAQESVHFDVSALLGEVADEKTVVKAEGEGPREDQAQPIPPLHSRTDSKRPGYTESSRPKLAAPAQQLFPCLFCPQDTSVALVDVPNGDVRAMQARAAARKSLAAAWRPVRVHHLCACFIPETWVDAHGAPHVRGTANIDPARWALKCQVCGPQAQSRYGAKIQCTKGRCPRAAHVSCALDEPSGWFMDICAHDVADRLEGASAARDGEERLVVLCRAHNPLRLAQAAAERDDALRAHMESLPVGSVVDVRSRGGVWTTRLRVVNTESCTVLVDASMDDSSSKVSVPWSRVVQHDAAATETPVNPPASEVELHEKKRQRTAPTHLPRVLSERPAAAPAIWDWQRTPMRNVSFFQDDGNVAYPARAMYVARPG